MNNFARNFEQHGREMERLFYVAKESKFSQLKEALDARIKNLERQHSDIVDHID